MKYNFNLSIIIALSFIITGCATTSPNIVKLKEQTEPIKEQVVIKIEPSLKRKVAIARFSNEAQYGKSMIFGDYSYNAEKQATDILSTKLTQSEKFILLERSDLDKINEEISRFNLKSLNIGADYLIVGSVTEFGRKSMSDTGVFSRTKTQTAYAKVSVRLVEVKTGQIIFAQEGSGEAKSEAGTSFGVGKNVGYDSTLNDKAISAAISSVVDGIMQNLLNKPWKSYVLSIEDGSVIIAGGQKQGIKVGDTFNIYKAGKSIKNPQTGMMIELPGSKTATIQVVSQFGSTDTDEGSVCIVTNGSVNNLDKDKIYVQK